MRHFCRSVGRLSSLGSAHLFGSSLSIFLCRALEPRRRSATPENCPGKNCPMAPQGAHTMIAVALLLYVACLGRWIRVMSCICSSARIVLLNGAIKQESNSVHAEIFRLQRHTWYCFTVENTGGPLHQSCSFFCFIANPSGQAFYKRGRKQTSVLQVLSCRHFLKRPKTQTGLQSACGCSCRCFNGLTVGLVYCVMSTGLPSFFYFAVVAGGILARVEAVDS